MAGRPAKSAKIIAIENKTHKAKAELAARAAAEVGTLSGSAMVERQDVREDPAAHKEFIRLRKLFRAIEKDDELYSQAINDYCMLHSECLAVSVKIARVEHDLDILEQHQDEMKFDDYLKMRNSLYDKELKLSAELDKKRDKKRAIEDKNLMNIQSALRSIPKKQDDKKNPLREALRGAVI